MRQRLPPHPTAATVADLPPRSRSRDAKGRPVFAGSARHGETPSHRRQHRPATQNVHRARPSFDSTPIRSPRRRGNRMDSARYCTRRRAVNRPNGPCGTCLRNPDIPSGVARASPATRPRAAPPSPHPVARKPLSPRSAMPSARPAGAMRAGGNPDLDATRGYPAMRRWIEFRGSRKGCSRNAMRQAAPVGGPLPSRRVMA